MATDVATARGNIGIIKAYVAAGRLGIEEGGALIEPELKTIDAHMASVIELDVKSIERTVGENPPASPTTITGGLPALPLGPQDSPLIMPEFPEPPDNPWKPNGGS